MNPNPPYLAHISEDHTRTQTVREHLENTAALAAEFARPFGGEEAARLSGLLHDIGKYSRGFQERLHGGRVVDHSTAGAQVSQKLRQTSAAFAIAGHHGGIPDGGSRTDTAGQATLFGRLKRALPDCSAWQSEIRLPQGPVRHPDFLRHSSPFAQFFYTRMLYSCLVDADYQDTETFMRGSAAPRGGHASLPELLALLERYIEAQGWWNATTPLNQKRSEILKACFAKGASFPQGLYTLTVPTGGGKTVASLAFAFSMAVKLQMQRVIYVIPYTSIIDQTAGKFQEILGAENVLEHHSGAEYLMQTDAANGSSLSVYRKVLATENWDVPVVVTTAVQFFESLYANRSSRCRKLHNIAQSVVIFDEAQTLPVPYLRPCVAAIAELVQHYGVTAVLCTATQPKLAPLFQESGGLTAQEICPDRQALSGFFRRATFQNAGTLNEEALANELGAARQVLCVVNRRKTAQALYQSLPREGSFCLTTLLCPASRKQKIAEIRTRLAQGLSCRVVSTSLIEAGVDLDFPAAWREEAGLDSILQAAGRCNREGRRPPEQSLVKIFRLEGAEPLSLLRTNIAALHAAEKKHSDLASPSAADTYFDYFLKLKGRNELDRQQILKSIEEGHCGSVFPFAHVADSFRLIDSPTTAIYLPIGEGAGLVNQLRAGLHEKGLYRKLGQYAVSVYPQHLEALEAAGAVERLDSGCYVLTRTDCYDPDTGLQLEVEGGVGLFS